MIDKMVYCDVCSTICHTGIMHAPPACAPDAPAFEPTKEETDEGLDT